MRGSRRLLWLPIVIATACASGARSAGHPLYVITADSLRRRLEDFSADSMLGRHWVDGGHDRATDYLSRELGRIGLEPAGEHGGWFQPFHMYWRRVSPESRLLIAEATLVVGRDFKVFSFGRGQPRSMDGAQVVYGGIVGDTSTQISSAAADSRVVILTVPRDMTPERVYRDVSYGPTSRFGRAAGVVIASYDYLSPSQRATSVAVGPLDSTTPIANAQPSTVLVTARAAAALLGRPLDNVPPGTLGGIVKDRIRVDERDATTRNVIAVLPGEDPSLARTYVALGAHSDHLGPLPVALDHDSVRAAAMTPAREGDSTAVMKAAALRQQLAAGHLARRDSIFNGADDDGSGSVALLEVARALVSQERPKRSVLFVWHAAEEDGLVGSSWFVEHPTVPLDAIVAEVNLDMVGRGGAADIANGGPRYLQVLGASRRSRDFASVIDSVNRRLPAPFAIDTVDAEHAYCRSDHWNYARFGIPIAFLTTGSHADYHAVTDEASYIDYSKLAAVTQFTVGIAQALANRATRLSTTGPRSDPRAFCHG